MRAGRAAEALAEPLSAPIAETFAEALRGVATELGSPARETILFENAGKHLLELTLISAALPPRGRLLDVGGGLGVNLLALRGAGARDEELVLLDRFDEYTDENRMGSAARAFPLLESAGVDIVEEEISRDRPLPLDDDHFDVVTLFDVVEHLPHHPLALLTEIRRVLVPGGTLLLSGPNAVSLMKRLRAFFGRYPYATLDAWLEEPFFEHYREYTPEEYATLLERAGFEVRQRILSSEPWPTRARNRYHRVRLSPLSPRVAALHGMRVLEACWPGWRHSVYCAGLK